MWSVDVASSALQGYRGILDPTAYHQDWNDKRSRSRIDHVLDSLDYVSICHEVMVHGDPKVRLDEQVIEQHWNETPPFYQRNREKARHAYEAAKNSTSTALDSPIVVPGPTAEVHPGQPVKVARSGARTRTLPLRLYRSLCARLVGREFDANNFPRCSSPMVTGRRYFFSSSPRSST